MTTLRVPRRWEPQLDHAPRCEVRRGHGGDVDRDDGCRSDAPDGDAHGGDVDRDDGCRGDGPDGDAHGGDVDRDDGCRGDGPDGDASRGDAHRGGAHRGGARRQAVPFGIFAAIVVAACGGNVVAPSAPQPLPVHTEIAVDTSPKARPRVVAPEVYLRAYLAWFGGLAPLEVQQKARGKQLFDAWDDYLAALGLPDYRLDLPRQPQTNTLMVATFGRLGEALCMRAAEHDLHNKKTPLDQRVVFAFDMAAAPTDAQFGERFDVLHRTFLGYPSALAPADRAPRYLALYRAVAARHPAKNPLTADETAWAAVCAALVQHPEAELY